MNHQSPLQIFAGPVQIFQFSFQKVQNCQTHTQFFNAIRHKIFQNIHRHRKSNDS